jgi:hypothetical protein
VVHDVSLTDGCTLLDAAAHRRVHSSILNGVLAASQAVRLTTNGVARMDHKYRLLNFRFLRFNSIVPGTGYHPHGFFLVGGMQRRCPMSLEDDYRRNAAESVALARRTGSSAGKGRLLRLAEAWLDLANQAERVARRGKVRDHPLVRAKLGPRKHSHT